MNKEQLKKAIAFMSDVRHLNKKYNLDYQHIKSKHFSPPGRPYATMSNMNMIYPFSRIDDIQKEEKSVIEEYYDDYIGQYLGISKTSKKQSL